MKLNNLLILDLSSNYKINRKDCHVIKIDKGQINLNNYIDQTDKLDIQKKNSQNNQKITNGIYYYLNKFNFFFKDNDIYKSELANFRDDKVDIYDKVKCFIGIKKINLEKKYNIEVITDKINSARIFNQIFKKYTLVDLSKKKLKNPYLNFFLIRTIFVIKFLLINIYLKFYTKQKKINKKIGLSIYPLFFKEKNKKLYKTNDATYLNFLFTDETHISKNIYQMYKIINYLKKKKNFYFIERDISILDIIINFLASFKFLLLIKKVNKTDIIIDNINFNSLFSNYLYSSIINLLKLKNYNKVLQNIFSKKDCVDEFHYFLFEYNFGFYLADIIKKCNNSIKLHGYQHGIFGKNTCWFNVIKKAQLKNSFSPDIIHCIFKESIKYYNYHLKKKVTYNSNISKKLYYKILPKRITKTSKNCLFYLGLHDGIDIMNQILYEKKFMKNFDKIYIKYHPKKKELIKVYDNKNRFKFINDVKNIKFKEIYLSPSSSLKYVFENFKIPFKLAKIPYKSLKN